MSEALPGLGKRLPRRRTEEPAALLPVARVLVDTPLPHLDHPFDYLVPARLDAQAQPGARLRVRFAGALTDAYLLERSDRADHEGTLAYLSSVTSPLPVVTGEVLTLARAVARRYAGTLADVLRLAIVPRHARTEADVLEQPSPPADSVPQPDGAAWRNYRGGEAFLARLAAGASPRAVWTALPARLGPWPAIAAAAAATVTAGRSVVVVTPRGRDLPDVTAALSATGLADVTVTLDASDTPAARYRSYLAALGGSARVVIGTRAAVFAPVRNLGLVVVWDEASDLLREQRAPYPDATVVAALRAELAGAGLLLGSYSRSTYATTLVGSGWAASLTAPVATVRQQTARVQILGTDDLAAHGPGRFAQIPGPVVAAMRKAAADGPVLVQVPRAGTVPVLVCQTCREVARCATCAGPLQVVGSDTVCQWCGTLATTFRCRECGGTTLRAASFGQEFTAGSIGRLVQNTPVIASSAAAGVRSHVPDEPAVVVATTGAEPRAANGYRLTVLLDAAASARRAGFQAGEEALRRWLSAAALTIPARRGGAVMLVGDVPARLANAFAAWNPVSYAERELAERTELGFPPAVRMAAVEGDASGVGAVLADVADVPEVRILGPAPVEEPDALVSATVRALVAAPLTESTALLDRLADVVRRRSARREPAVRIHVDPEDLT